QQVHNDEAGQGLIEYVMLSALVISAAAACFPGLATALTTAFTKIGTKRSEERRVGKQWAGTAAVRTYVLRLERAGASIADRAPARGGIHRRNYRRSHMEALVQRFQQLHKDEAGQGLIEYVMLCALVISAAAACFPGLADALTTAFTKIGTKLGQYIA